MSRKTRKPAPYLGIPTDLPVQVQFQAMSRYRILSSGSFGALARAHSDLVTGISVLQNPDDDTDMDDIEGLLMAVDRIEAALMTMDNAAPFVALHGELIGESAEVIACHSRALPLVINRPDWLPSLAADRGVF